MTWLDHRRWIEERDEDADRQTVSLAAVAVTLLLLVIGLFLVRTLHHAATIEDCLLSGRTNCITVAAGR
jgi:hypothetical protein